MIKDNLKNLRKKANKTQLEVAKFLHLSQNAYCKYELGQTEPSIDTLIQLANIFNCTVEDIVRNDTINKTTNIDDTIISLLNKLNYNEQLKVKAYIQGLIDNRPTTQNKNTYNSIINGNNNSNIQINGNTFNNNTKDTNN